MKGKNIIVGTIILSATLALSACGSQTKANNVHSESSSSKVSHKKESKKESSKKTHAKKASQTKKESTLKASESSKKLEEQKQASESAKALSSTEQAAKASETNNVAASAAAAQQNNTPQQAANNNQNTSNNVVPAPTPTPAPAESKVLDVPFVSQGSTMLCEGSSLLEALHYKGVTSQGIYQFVNSMPKSSDNNPYNGYAGEWNRNVDGTYQGMMAGPVVQWAASVGGHAAQISGPAAIKNSIRNGNPVVAWIVYDFAAPQFKQMPWGRAVWNGHVVCVDGFNQGGYHIVDPNAGAYWVSTSAFEGSNGVTGMAVSVG